MKKIIITDSIDKKCINLLEDRGYRVDYKPGISFDELEKIIGEYSVLIVRSSTGVTSKLIDKMNNMEVIGRAGTGVDNIDIEAATRKGILVMNTPGGNTISAAEHTLSLMLSMFRNIPQANQSLRSGKWERNNFKGAELFNKTLGIIGLGKIGKEVANRASSFGMKIIGFDPIVSNEVAEKSNIKKVDLDKLFSDSDVITVHVPLNEETKNIISKDSLSKCKDGIKIINCARGGIVNEQAVIDGIKNGKVSSAAFDVYENEPPDFFGELIQNEKIITTPHLGASTEEAQEKVAVQIAEQISDYYKNNSLTGVINASQIKGIENEKLKPFVMLAEKIGILYSHLIKGNLNSIEINCSGELLSDSISLISTAVLKGLFSSMMNDVVNYINAPVLAKEMGIKINASVSNSRSNYSNLIQVFFNSDEEKRSLAGTVFGNDEQRIVNLDGFHIEFKPEGNLLIYENLDKPGVLASVSIVLSNSDINIGSLSLGRVSRDENAVTVINLDSKITTDIINKIKTLNGIKEVYAVDI